PPLRSTRVPYTTLFRSAWDRCSPCSTRSGAWKGLTRVTTNKVLMADNRTNLSLMGRLMPTIMRLRRSNRNHLTRDHVRRFVRLRSEEHTSELQSRFDLV